MRDSFVQYIFENPEGCERVRSAYVCKSYQRPRLNPRGWKSNVLYTNQYACSRGLQTRSDGDQRLIVGRPHTQRGSLVDLVVAWIRTNEEEFLLCRVIANDSALDDYQDIQAATLFVPKRVARRKPL